LRFLVDTNLLVYAVNRGAAEHDTAVTRLRGWLDGTVPWCITWSIAYEFLRVVTHPRVFRKPLTALQAVSFLDPILACDVVSVIGPTTRHHATLSATVKEVRRVAGNFFHDVHTAVLMREHGVPEIMTADAGFKRFRFLKVTNPLR
jgi:uncharacterized protein